jgi:hypothetical protein
MSLRDDAFTAHQLKRWMRPDSHRFVCADWRRLVRPGFERDFPFELYERKYSPEQPRDDHGRWTSEGGGEGSGSAPQGTGTEPMVGSGRNDPRILSDATPDNSYRPGTQFAARISPQREAECEEQYRLDTFICNTVRTRSCWSQANFRRSQCLIGGYVPPIYH